MAFAECERAENPALFRPTLFFRCRSLYLWGLLLKLCGVTFPAAIAVPRPDPYAAFRHTGYRHFVFGRLIFLIGTQMQTAAVGWQIYQRLGTTLALYALLSSRREFRIPIPPEILTTDGHG